MADGSMKSHTPTPHESMLVYRDAIDLLEVAYNESAGEVTEETQALEQIEDTPSDPVARLRDELDDAVQKEDYERAARLRDHIRELS